VTATGGAAVPSETTPGTIYVLLPVHDRRALTEGFVRCLAAQTDQGFHLILVDDGSRDGTADAVRSIIPEATVLRGRGHWWWAGCLEQARRWLLHHVTRPGDIVLIANDDTTFEPDFLAAARSIIEREPRILLLAQQYSAQTGETTGFGSTIDWRKLSFKPAPTIEDSDVFPTRGLFLRLDDFLELGRFHTVLLPHYLSDYEFTLRAVRRGFALRSDPSVRLVMDEQTTGIRSLNLASPWAYLRSVLTIKATRNPIYWSTFVLLAAPRRYVLSSLWRIWRRFGSGLLKSARGRPVDAT
jgi:GT2 family glycosyltransferase